MQLEHVAATHITRDGLFVPPQGDGSSIEASAELESVASAGAAGVTVRFTLSGEDGSGARQFIATATSAAAAVPAAANGTATTTATARLTPPAGAVKQWTTKQPHMYSMLAEVIVNSSVVDTQVPLLYKPELPFTYLTNSADTQRAAVGFRTTSFSGTGAEPPFTLNEEPLSFRGFSHHNSIGGLGVALPERVQLFRVQASRAMGTNIW